MDDETYLHNYTFKAPGEYNVLLIGTNQEKELKINVSEISLTGSKKEDAKIELKIGSSNVKITKKYKALVTETFNRTLTKTINLNATKETPCCIEITPVIDLVELTIRGLSNEDIVIDTLREGDTILIE